ncbi:MAG: hypothetical protein K9G48_08610 [Reyranella sp.]|nr:hypothetical protein [Reyranella sp.]
MAESEYVDYFPPLGTHGGPGEPWIIATGLDPLDLGGHRGKDLLLIVEPADPASGVALGPYGPLGTPVWPEAPEPGGGEWGWNGARTTIALAMTTPRSTRNDDTPAATFIDGVLPASANFGSALFDGVDPMSRSRPTVGEIVLIDPDGLLDYLLDYVWDGAPVTVKRGDRGTPLSTWETVAHFTAKALVPDYDEKKIALRDLGWQLQGFLHNEYYAGTGGLEGDPSLKGRWKPWGLGYNFHVEPLLLNSQYQIFQWNLTSSSTVFAFKHGGVALLFDADYPTFEALRDAAIPSGYYGTCLAHSLARPNVDLEFGVRVDFIGDASTAYGHPQPTTRAAIARRIATTRGLSRLDDAAQIDMTAFARVENRHSAPVGWHFSEPMTKADALDLVMAGILGWWKIRPDGRLAIGYVGSPVIGAALSIDFKSDGMGKPRMVATSPPRAGTHVSWRTNAAPQSRSELALSIDDETAAILGQEARYAQALSPAVSTLYPTARVVVVANSGFWFAADSNTEAARQQGILEIERNRWQWEMMIDPFIDLTGIVASIIGVNRLGFGESKPLLSVGIDTQGTSQVTLDWWG